MGFRLQRRVKIAPGLTMNISKHGLGFSAGPRGAKISVGPNVRRASVGIPGTGMRYQVGLPGSKKASGGGSSARPSRQAPASMPPRPTPGIMSIGFLGKAFKQPYEKEFIEGAQRLVKGDQQGARVGFEQAALSNPSCLDAGLICALLLINAKEYAAAQGYLEKVVQSGQMDFPLIDKYLGPDLVSFELPITGDVTVPMLLDMRSAYLTLAEVYQAQERAADAIAVLQRAIGQGYRDPVVKLSLVELYNDIEKDDELIAVAQGTENTDNVSLAILFYLGQAMMRKGYYEAAAETLKAAVARRKDRDEHLLLEARYILGQVYEQSGKKAQARKQYEQIIAKDINFRDVKVRVDALSNQ